MREIENERETIRLRSAKPEFDNPLAQAGLQKRQQALNAEVSALEAATIAIKIFAAALDQAAEESKSNLNAAQQAADEARRADLGNSTLQTQEARARTQSDLERQREAEQKVRAEVAVERDKLEKMQRADAEEVKKIDEQLKSGIEPDPGQVKKRGQAEADAAESGKSVQAFEKAIAAQKAYSDGIDEQLKVFWELVGDDAAEKNKGLDEVLKRAGRDDLLENNARAYRAMADAERAAGIDPKIGLNDAKNTAKEGLAAARERQQKAANDLAQIDPAGGGREDLIRRRAALEAKMEADAIEGQARIDEAGLDASTREEEQRKSAGRGLDLMRASPESTSARFAEETSRGLSDIKSYFQRRTDANKGIPVAGDAEIQAAAEDRFRKDREKEARTATKEGRGRELGMTERERFQRDMREGTVADLTARAKEMQGQGQDPAAFLRQGIANQIESVAPMMKQLQMEREDMLLQGPSRKALQVSDVSTSQGASELTRLLRGDDSAKDLNLAELKKQSQRLEDLIQAVKDANPTVLL
jgi:hypothetical protein